MTGKRPQHSTASSARIGVYITGAVVFVLALAWYDGGEEPIRPISQPVELSDRGNGL